MPGKGELRKEAFEMFKNGVKLVEISKQLGVPAGTVRRWKHDGQWGANAPGTNAQGDAQNERQANARRKRRVRGKEKEGPPAQKAAGAKLTEKQRLFCFFYVRYFNATKAYLRAYGCEYSTAASAGYRMLKNAEIRREIAALKQGRMDQAMLEPSDIFQKYMDIAFSDITDFLTFGQKEIPVMGPFGPVRVEDPDTGEKVELTKVVNSVDFRESGEVDGTLISEVKQGRDGASIKLADRMKALNWLADHLDLATPEQRAKVEKLEAETERIRNSGGAGGEDDGVEIINDCP